MTSIDNEPSIIHTINEDGDLNYKGSKFNLLFADNSYLLNLLDGTKNRNININPYGFSRVLLAGVFKQLHGIKKEIENINDENIKRLEIGQKVKVDGSIGLIEDIGENNVVKVKFKDLLYMLPKASRWKINPYYGTKKVTNYNFKPNKYIKKERQVLKEIFNLDTIELPAIENYKTLIVCNKKELIHFKNVTLKNVLLIDLIPSGYYIDKHNYERIGKDPLQRNPLLCFTSNLEIASELLKSDSNIKNVIVYGKDKVEGQGVYLDQINNNKQIDSFSIIMDIIDLDSEVSTITDKINFEIIKEASSFNNGTKSFFESSNGSENNLISKRNIIANRLNNNNNKQLNVETYVDELLNNLKKKILTLKNDYPQNNYITKIIIKILGFINFIRTVPLSLKEVAHFYPNYRYKNIVYELESEKIDILASTSSQTYEVFEEIIKVVEQVISVQSSNNKKGLVLKNVLETLEENDCIVVYKKHHIDILSSWIRHIIPNKKVNIKTINQLLKEETFYKNIYFIGWYDYKVFFVESKGIGKNSHYIFYDDEQKIYNFNQNKFRILLHKYFEKDSINENYPNKQIDKTTNSVDENLNDILDKMEVALKHTYQSTDTSNVEDTTLVLFEEGQFSFLTKGYNCNVLNREKETIYKKNVSDLEILDEIVFIDTDKDVFKELVNKVRSSSSALNSFYELSDLWKDSLKNYQEKSDYSEVSLTNQLKEYGIIRHPATVANWLNDSSVIGTNEVIEATSKLTGNEKLKINLQEVKDACKNIRSMHIKLGRYLAGSIINSYNADVEEVDKVIQESINDLKSNINIVTVEKKNSEAVSVPYFRANRLLAHD